MFVPGRCPYPACRFHLQPTVGFFLRRGFYHPQCRSQPVQRFLCRGCGRSFSRQSFRADFAHKKPYLNATFLRLMVSCVGLRQAARLLQVARRTVEHRFRWLSLHASRYGALRRKGRMTRTQKLRRAEHEARHGRRPSQSLSAVREALLPLRHLVHPEARVVLHSDEKPLYGWMGRRLFGSRFLWRPHSSRARRRRRSRGWRRGRTGWRNCWGGVRTGAGSACASLEMPPRAISTLVGHFLAA
jgi:transposase-like protein